MKWAWVAPAVIAAATFWVRTASASCGQAACSVDSRLNESASESNAIRFDTSFEYIEQDHPWVRHHGVDVGEIPRDDHSEVETTNMTWKLGAEARIAKRFTVGIVLPVVHREHLHLANEDHASHALVARHAGSHGGTGTSEETDDEEGQVTIGDATGTPERWEFTRLGDLQILGGFDVWQDPQFSLRLIAGLKLPSGETGVRNDEGERGEITLQPGTGSVDPIFGISGQFLLDDLQPGAVIAGSVMVRTEGSDGRYGFRPGTEVVTTFGGDYPVWSRLHALTQVNIRYRDRDHVGDAPGVAKEHTGGEAIYVSPGVRVEFTDQLHGQTWVQVPVYQRVNGIQLVSDWNLLLALSYRFDLPSL